MAGKGRRASFGSFRIAVLHKVMDGEPVGRDDVSGAKQDDEFIHSKVPP